MTINSVLIDALNLSSTACMPQGYMREYPEQSINAVGFVPNNYYTLLSALFTSSNTFQDFKDLANVILNRPYNPLYCDITLLEPLKNVIGINFVLTELPEDQLRQILYAKLLSNTSSGDIKKTIAIYQALVKPTYIQRIRIGNSPGVSYCAVGGTLPISTDELNTFWQSAVTAGVYVELSHAIIREPGQKPLGFLGNPNCAGLASISGGVSHGGGFMPSIIFSH